MHTDTTFPFGLVFGHRGDDSRRSAVEPDASSVRTETVLRMSWKKKKRKRRELRLLHVTAVTDIIPNDRQRSRPVNRVSQARSVIEFRRVGCV